MNSPFFSVIIPVYNPNIEQFEHMLDSLTKQIAIDKEDIEVIFVDDCSPNKAFLNSLNDFEMPYRLLSTEVNSGQGVAREIGTKEATGEWITYLDQDDTLTTSALVSAKMEIKYSKCEFLLDTKVIIADNYDWAITGLYHIINTDDVLHAKFINRKELVRRGIHFHSKLRTAEDTYFYNICVVIAIHESKHNGRENYFVQSPTATYVWYLWDNSTSHKFDNGIDYFEKNFDDYVTACIDSTDCLTHMLKTTLLVKPRIISALINFYHHYELYTFRGKAWGHNPTEMMKSIRRYYKYVQQFGMTKDEIKRVLPKCSEIYCDLLMIISSRQSPYIPEHSLYEFLDMI